uniref:DsbC family protein n=1 Tax=Neisseria leonii TaxID=2995413 RepID=UPI003F58C7C8
MATGTVMKPTPLLLAALCLPLAACGKPAADTNAERTIRAKLEKAYAGQNLSVSSVQETPAAGLYEVVLGGRQIVYTDAKADYLLVGEMIDIANKTNLTEARSEELNKIDFAALPLDKAIKEVRGKGELKVAVFSDPDCPFCRKLEAEFAKTDNLTIYTFLMPISSLHPQAAAKSVRIWCQPDRTAAWLKWMREGQMPPAVAECTNPVADTTALGEQLGFNGTPTLVFPNGRTQAGFMPLPQLMETVRENQ